MSGSPSPWRLGALALRALALALLVAPALGALDRPPFAPARYALVLDESPSVRRRFPGYVEQARAGWDELAGGTWPVVGAGPWPHPPGRSPANPSHTDLPAALETAAGLAGGGGGETRVLVASDGLSAGLDERLAARLRAGRVRVFALRAPSEVPQVRLGNLRLPGRVFLYEPFTVAATVYGSQPGTHPVALLRDGEVVAEAEATLPAPGGAEVQFLQEAERVGRLRYEIRLKRDGAPGAGGEVAVARSPRVLWLSDDPAAAGDLVGLLRGAGLDVDLTHPADLLPGPTLLAGAEVVVLDDLPTAGLAEDVVAALRRALGSGASGLVVFGGRKGLGSTEFEGSPLETLLPVQAGYRAPPPPAPVSLVLALDTSFSMFYRGSGEKVFNSAEPRKIDVAKESAKAVARIVRPGDRFGVLGNSTDIFWIAPLAEVGDREEVAARIDRVFPDGDGIYFYSVLHEAREALRRQPGGVRHVLVLCDAEDVDQYEVAGRGHAFDLLRAMADEGMTVSILAIGRPTDKDVPFLRTAALLGRGDFYLVPRIVALPRYFVAEYRRLAAGQRFLEEEIGVLAADPGALPPGTPGAFPPLSGVALVTAREGSRTVLGTTAGAPLLVTGEQGRGRTVVFASDSGARWAARWTASSELRRFWLQTIFGAAPPEGGTRGFAALLEADREPGRLRFHYVAADGSLPPWDRVLALPEPGSGGEPVALERVGLRAYRGPAPPGAATYRRVVIAAEAASRPIVAAGFRAAPPEEDLPVPARLDTLGELVAATGGSWVREPAEIAAPGPAAPAGIPLRALAVAIALLLLLAETALRNRKEE